MIVPTTDNSSTGQRVGRYYIKADHKPEQDRKIHNGGCILEHCPEIAKHPSGSVLHLCRNNEDWTLLVQGAAQRFGNYSRVWCGSEFMNLRKDSNLICSSAPKL